MWPLIAIWTALAGPAGPEATWVRVTTEHFEIWMAHSQAEARAWGEHLEAARQVVLADLNLPDPEGDRLRLMAVSSLGQLGLSADALYLRDGWGETVLVGRTTRQALAAATHEMVHSLVARAGWNPPLWLSEGLAEYYATLRFEGGQAWLGRPAPARAMRLRRQAWLPLEDLLNRWRKSGAGVEGRPALEAYRVAWALTTLLAVRQGEEFPALVRRIVDGASLEEAAGLTLDDIEGDLQRRVEAANWVETARAWPEAAGRRQAEPVAAWRAEAALYEVGRRLRSGYGPAR